jgi:DNA-binding transcriptional LysR family regulator
MTIAMPHSATISVFPSFKHQLAKGAIYASFSVRIANHDSVGSMLANSECDLALATSHPKVPQSLEFSALRSIEVAKERLVIVSSAEWDDRKPAPLHVSDRRTYIGQIWQRCRISMPSTVELEHDMAADIRNYCLAGEGRGVVPLSLVEADTSSGRLRNLPSDPNLAYTFLLYCAPKASMQAKRIWSSAASIFGAT